MIDVTDLTKRYGTRTAIDRVTFTAAAGRVTGFVGPNGAGKSTAMRSMVGLTRPDHGEVRYAGVPFAELTHPSAVVGAVLDARSMHPGRTARDHLRATAALGRIPRRRVDAVLDEVGLASVAHQRTGGFSLGMRQRLGLAGALLGEPEVLLLDEPSNGLDPDGIRWLRTYLRGYADRGGTVFVSSHLIAELALFADDLVVIGGGRVIAAGTVADITADAERTVVAETERPDVLLDLLRGHGIAAELVTTAAGDKLVAHGTDRRRVARLAFDHAIRLDELTQTATSLEDVLLELTRETAEFAAA